MDPTLLFASVISSAAPVIIAAIGENITEKCGIINLSLDGAILLSAMAAFVVTYETGSLTAGCLAAILCGAAVAAVVAVFGVYLGQSQVAVGFVLTLMTRDLAYFLGNDYSRMQGPQFPPLPIPLLKDIPFIGPVFFNHNLMVYLALSLIFISWWYMSATAAGLRLKAVGENPSATYARGISSKRLQLVYTCLGGALVGLSGAAFSLFSKPGWGHPQGAEGTGWIVLALVIFGGWHPFRVAAGACLFALLQVLSIYFQGWFPNIPVQIFQVAPFPLMIFTLVFFHLSQKPAIMDWAEDKAAIKILLEKITSPPPSALGKAQNFDE